MTERQRDLFLYQWSRRRRPGGTRIALRGAAIGAVGGMTFWWILVRGGAATGGVLPYDYAGQIRSALGLLALAVPAFALIGWTGARRVWTTHEGLYRSLLGAGARVPEEKPALTLADRGPALAVAITVVVMAGFILYLFWAASTGRL
jgi:FtsH-binding integral membrane protein